MEFSDPIVFDETIQKRIRQEIAASICMSHIPLASQPKVYVVSRDHISERQLKPWRILSDGLQHVAVISRNIFLGRGGEVVLLYPSYFGTFQAGDNPSSESVSATTLYHYWASVLAYYNFDGSMLRLRRDFADFWNISFSQRRQDFQGYLGRDPISTLDEIQSDIIPRYPTWRATHFVADKLHYSKGPMLYAGTGDSVFKDFTSYIENVLPLYTFFPKFAQDFLTAEEMAWLDQELTKLPFGRYTD